MARLVATLAQQKKRAETEQRAREVAESSAERVGSGAPRFYIGSLHTMLKRLSAAWSMQLIAF